MARILAFRLMSEGFSNRSRRRNSRFSPERSTIFRNRRTASCTDSRSRNVILTKIHSPQGYKIDPIKDDFLMATKICLIAPPVTPHYNTIDGEVEPPARIISLAQATWGHRRRFHLTLLQGCIAIAIGVPAGGWIREMWSRPRDKITVFPLG